MTFTETIKNYVLHTCKADAVGIASISAFDNEPEGHKPLDILPDAKSVIVFTKHIPAGVVQAAFRHFEDGNEDAQSIYAAYGSDLFPNMRLFFVSFNLAEYIERHFGFTAVPLPCGPNQNAVSVNMPLPIFVGPKKLADLLDPDHAAVAAGLGDLGWNNLLVTEDHGPRQQIGMVITSMELDCDEPYSGPRLCDPQACGVCSGVCPMNALPAFGGESEGGCIGGRDYEVAHINVNACAVASLAFRNEFSGKIQVPDLIDNDNPTNAEIAEAYAKKPISDNSLDHYPRHYCNKCMLYCPLGNWDGLFADRGLSTFKREEQVA